MLQLGAAEPNAEPLPTKVEFNRDIRPILSDACFQCHGLDEAERQANLRFDTQEGAFADLGGYRAIVPGKPGNSELVRRIKADVDERMPPVDFARQLTPQQIALLELWVKQGAEWQDHWSLVTPKELTLPKLKKTTWVRNPIDAFVFAKLEREGLLPSSEADKTTLIRRATLDLTGLPPTPQEVDDFLLDNSPSAYDKVIDRLLDSPAYGERMAVRWLDAARYADTSGYQTDGVRFMWRWRDWVIDAFNNNIPFDQFTIEQIAGDMLPNATLEQKIATGFNRNHRGNAEGGIISAEYQVEYVVDRVDTTATVWLGLTMGCARCHDHKYDPITQKEFYQVYAFFNNIPERGKAFKFGNAEPWIPAPLPAQQEELDALEQELQTAEREFSALESEITTAQRSWEQAVAGGGNFDEDHAWYIDKYLAAHFPLDGGATNAGNEKVASEEGKEPPAPRFIRGTAAYSDGAIGEAAIFDGERYLEIGVLADLNYIEKFTFSAWVYLEGDGGGIFSKMTDAAESPGYNFHIKDGKLQANFASRWLDDAVRVETLEPISRNEWHHVAAVYDGSRRAHGIHLYVDGFRQETKANVDDLNQGFNVNQPLRIGSRGTRLSFEGRIDDVRIYRDALKLDGLALLSTRRALREIASAAPSERSAAEESKLRTYFLETVAPEALRNARERMLELRVDREKLIESFPTTMVMEEMETPRDTHVLIRGAYNKPGEKVAPGIPASLPPLPKGAPNNRLGFAQWLVDAANPLTSRVTVNRFWQMYFGAGIVRSTEDFGSQGERPSHPQLLDWLATEFIRSGWDVKQLQKTILTSATYRQSSAVTPELLQQDPDNRLLARGARLRLPAEMIRDQALAIGGLLVKTIGGPSVKPYQPSGLWQEVSGHKYQPDKGDSLYRRTMYTFFKRSVAPPAMMAFDAAGREACVVRETRTNTPLQALNLLNDATYIEAARKMAERVIVEGGKTPRERLNYAFRLAVGRRAQPAELRILTAGLESHRERYQSDAEAAKQLLSVGEAPLRENLEASEVAAYTAIANLILNLDEVITKE